TEYSMRTNLQDNVVKGEGTKESFKFSYSAGITYHFKVFKRGYMDIGLSLIDKGCLRSVYYAPGYMTSIIDENMPLIYLGVPLSTIYPIRKIGHATVFVELGVIPERLLYENDDPGFYVTFFESN